MDISESGVQIRNPSTANLMIDSKDRVNLNNFPTFAAQFYISKTNSILNGFFNRIATSEVVLEWFVPNISGNFNNNDLTIDISGAGASTGANTTTYQAPSGYYTQSELIRWVLSRLNASGAFITPAVTWALTASTTQAGCVITPNANVWIQLSGSVANKLAINTTFPILITAAGAGAGIAFNLAVDLRYIRYLDFVSPQLTYNQELKDSATNIVARDVLCRWYMAYDNPPTYDEFGFPILMGYSGFILRRLFSPPKNIKWDPRQPVGQLSFEVYSDLNQLAPFNFNSNWLMTLQISEN